MELKDLKITTTDNISHGEDNSSRFAAYSRIVSRMPYYINRAIQIARPLVYVSEIGKYVKFSFPQLSNSMYALAIGYVIGDVALKSYMISNKNYLYRKYYLFDLSLWHLISSFVLPAILVRNYIRLITKYLGKYTRLDSKSLILVSAVSAMCMIPFVIKPLDNFTDWLMDNSYRNYFDYKEYDDEPTILVYKN